MSVFNFTEPSRQSVKGILVIFAFTLYKTTKQFIIVFSIFLFKYLKNDSETTQNNYYLFGGIAVLIYLLINAILRYKNFKFHVTETHFVLQNGVFNKEETSISKHKIQNVYIKQNIIQQLINVVSLAIETAGDDKTEIEIKALSKEKAKVLKELLLEYKKSNNLIKPENELKSIKVEGKSYLYKASLKKILLEGFSENHFRSLFLILLFLGGFYNDFEGYVSNYYNKFNIDYLSIGDVSLFYTVLINFAIILSLIIIAISYSCIKIVLENFDLKVEETDSGLEISKGLFNKISLGLQASRIQNTTLKTNRLKESLNLYKLSFTQAMLNKKQQKHFNIIGLSKDQIKELIIRFYANIFELTKKYKPEKYFIFKQIITYGLLIFFFNVTLYFLPTSFLYINIPLFLISTLYIYYSYKKTYYTFNDKFLTVGSGQFIDTITDYLELHKIQSIQFKQTIFQKRRGIASLRIYSASKPLKINHIKEVDAKNILNYFIYNVESSPKNWM